jgi:hypothetical protein
MNFDADALVVLLAKEAALAACAAACAELDCEGDVTRNRLRDALRDEIERVGPIALRELRENLGAGLRAAATQEFLAAMRLAGVRAARRVREQETGEETN